MIRHIVMWKFDASYSNSEREKLKKEIHSRLMFLDGKIDELKTIEVSFNASDAPEANFDVILDSTFNNLKDLNKYQVHEEHQKVVTYIKTLRLTRAACDYEI